MQLLGTRFQTRTSDVFSDQMGRFIAAIPCKDGVIPRVSLVNSTESASASLKTGFDAMLCWFPPVLASNDTTTPWSVRGDRTSEIATCRFGLRVKDQH